MSFESSNTLPDSLPQVCFKAIEYLKAQYPDHEDLVTALVIGQVGWDWAEEKGSYWCLNDIYYDAANIYQQQTGQCLANVPGFDWEDC